MHSILIVDGHSVVRRGVRDLVRRDLADVVLGEARNPSEGLEMAVRRAWDLVLLTVGMPAVHGIQALRRLRLAAPNTPVLVFGSNPPREMAAACITQGASGYVNLSADSAEVLRAIMKVMDGGSYVGEHDVDGLVSARPGSGPFTPCCALTEREWEIMAYVVAGNAIRDVARYLGLRIRTVNSYRLNILDKLGMRGEADLVRYAMHFGLLR